MRAELGLTPVELAQSRRLELARKLVEETTLPVTEVVFAAGFQSVRRFNAAFASAYGEPPARMRRGADDPPAGGSIALRLEYRGSLDWGAMIDELRTRAVPGVESADRHAYSRLARFGPDTGWVAVYPRVHQDALIAEVSLSLVRHVMPVVARLRRLFDVDRETEPRLPGAFDGFESAVVAVAGRTAAGGLAALVGEPFDLPYAPLERLPVDARTLAETSGRMLARAGARRPKLLRSLARAVAEGRISLQPTVDPLRVRARLLELELPREAVEVIAERVLRSTPRIARPGRLARPRPVRGRDAPARFDTRLIQGHKGITALIVPFDPERLWGSKPRKITVRQQGWLVSGRLNETPLLGWIGYRWGRFFVVVEPELRAAAGIEVGDEVTVVLEPTSTRGALDRAREQARVMAAAR